MENEDFTLRSGAILHLSTGAWSLVVPLWSAVKRVIDDTKGKEDPGSYLLTSEDVQKHLINLYKWATYDSVVIYVGLFDDPKIGDKIRVDQLEIWEKMLDFHLRPFFLMTSSKSMGSSEAHIKYHE